MPNAELVLQNNAPRQIAREPQLPQRVAMHDCMSNNYLLIVILLLALVVTAGCGREVPTQVAVKVNDVEITVHEVNFALARSRGITPETAMEVKHQILDRLIDQHLAMRKAIEEKLDRLPEVVQAIEAAKRDILARAYQDSLTRFLLPPTTQEIQDYYRDHPELFAQRRVFDLEDLSFVTTSDVASGLREEISEARSLQELAGWLQSRDVKIVVTQSVRAAEQIPLDILPKIQAMKTNEIVLFDAGDGRFQVIRVLASKAAPVDQAAATSRIRQFLTNRKSEEVVAERMKLLREVAKLEYVGEFANRGTPDAAKENSETQPKSEETAKKRRPK